MKGMVYEAKLAKHEGREHVRAATKLDWALVFQGKCNVAEW